MQRSDETLLKNSLEGDPEAFELLLPRYERKVYGLLLRLSGNPHDAQDLFQVVWMQAFAGRASFGGRSKFSTWLYAIAMNQVRDWRRRQAKNRARSGEMPADPADSKPGFLDRLLKRDREAQLQRSMRLLPPLDQELLALYYLQEMDYKDLAMALGRPVGPMRVQMHRALKRLKIIMEKNDQEK